MEIEERIRASEQLIHWLDSRLDGRSIPSNDRSQIAGACLDMTLEHQKAIVLLSAQHLYGSAAAIVRLVFEAYVRGVWFLYCASNEEIERFKDDRFERKFQELIDALEQLEAFDVGTLSRIKEASWRAMNSFTHTGLFQVARRLTGSEVMANFEPGEIVEAIDSADMFGLMAALAIADMSADEGFADEILDRSREFGAVEA